MDINEIVDSLTVECNTSLKGIAVGELVLMPVEIHGFWDRSFDNPWKELWPKKDKLTLRDIVKALQWGAPIDRVSAEIMAALDEAYRISTANNTSKEEG